MDRLSHVNLLPLFLVNDDIKLKPDRCGCEVDEAMKESDCREVVIKSTSRYIGAKSATTVDPAAGYNIASAGRYQRGSLTKVEKLTLVTIGFKSVAGMHHSQWLLEDQLTVRQSVCDLQNILKSSRSCIG